MVWEPAQLSQGNGKNRQEGAQFVKTGSIFTGVLCSPSSVLRMTVKRKRRKLRVTNNQMWSLLIGVTAEDPKWSVLGRLPLGGCVV